MKKFLLFFLAILLNCSIFAQVSNQISWQGILQDANGNNLDGKYNINVKIYNTESGGLVRWQETHLNKQIDNGLVNLLLGSVYPFTLDFKETYWLEFTIDNGTPLSRIKLTTVPYAIYALNSPNNGWGLTGNDATQADVNFIGTTDNQSLDFRTFYKLNLRLTTQGQLEFHNTGYSIFIGEDAGDNDDMSDNYNSFIGYQSGKLNTNGSDNIGLGAFSLLNNETGFHNIAIGNDVLTSNTTGKNNTGLGSSAMLFNQTGSSNIAIGKDALSYNKSADSIIAIGFRAMFYANNDENLSSTMNTAIGTEALRGSAISSNNTGTGNTVVGFKSAISNTSGYQNTALGVYTLFSNTTGYRNSAVGFEALKSNTTGNSNSAFGYNALKNNTSGESNTAIGKSSLILNTTGKNNTAIGSSALNSNSSGNNNIAIGLLSQYSNDTASNNISIGNLSLFNNRGGKRNIAIGDSTLFNLGNINEDIFSNENLAFGHRALYKLDNINSQENIAIGTYSMTNLKNGSQNIALGIDALSLSDSTISSIAIGYKTLIQNNGTDNIAIGNYSLYHNKSGSKNISIGYSAGAETGNHNIVIGFESGSDGAWLFSPGNFDNCTLVGHNIRVSDTIVNSSAFGYLSSVSNNNQIRIGNWDVESIGGYAGWTNLSDGRFKKNINENVPGLDFITKLKPITYNLDTESIKKALSLPDSLMGLYNNPNKSKLLQTGFIAQEVEEAAKQIGFDFSGVDKPKNEKDFYGLRYAEFVVPLVKAVQEQQAIIENQNKRIEELERKLEILMKNVNSNK